MLNVKCRGEDFHHGILHAYSELHGRPCLG